MVVILSRLSAEKEKASAVDGTNALTVVTVVVVETAVRTVEVPRVVGIVIGRRTPLLAYVVLTTHVLNS